MLSEAATDRPMGLFSVCWLNPVFAVSAGFRELDRWALAGERVHLPADQPEAVRPASGADRLGGTPGLLPLRPFPDWQWETELQVRFRLEGGGVGRRRIIAFSGRPTHRTLFINYICLCRTEWNRETVTVTQKYEDFFVRAPSLMQLNSSFVLWLMPVDLWPLIISICLRLSDMTGLWVQMSEDQELMLSLLKWWFYPFHAEIDFIGMRINESPLLSDFSGSYLMYLHFGVSALEL